MYDGYVFLCTNESQQQCLSNKLYTCAAGKKAKPPEEMKEGSLIFLYNEENRTLLGPFSVLPEGDELDAGAWALDVDPHIPSEDIKVTWEDLHILKNADEKLPFLKNFTRCNLTSIETQNALDLLKQGELYLYAKGTSP